MVEKIKNKSNWKIVVFSIIILAFIVEIFLNFENFFTYKTAPLTQELSVEDDKIEVYSGFENDIRNLQKELSELRDKIEHPVVEKNKEQLLRTALNIQNDLRTFKDYSANLKVLRILPLPKNIMREVEILDNGLKLDLTDKTINDDFYNELELYNKTNNLLDKSNNRFIKFISKFLTIKEKSDKNILFVDELQKAINRQDYKKATILLGGIDDFKKTKENLDRYALLNDAIDQIIVYLTTNGGF
ncbi:MAG: hypothetical protein Ta2D_02130 [Rickettsiales bacterium]|nr:MAG: hypothetical protein Ta2D_02130 [Rickettsiales bacterium]